jgi:cyclopropane-fatty-acyl-phospholipid synthase
MKTAIRLVESGLVPKPLIRRAIRGLLKRRLEELDELHPDPGNPGVSEWVRKMRGAPIAPVPDKANEQHYELPPEFFHLVLGKHLKYSSAFYKEPRTTLEEAEASMLALTCERADLANGQDILELGCGWGSLSLWMAKHYPYSDILAVSNSAPQREWIMAKARDRGLLNLEVVTRDMNVFDAAEFEKSFDRIVSVEMFEHMRNWEELLGRASRWIRPDGSLFLHVFAHRKHAYPFEVRDDSDWMSKYFFTGGQMPSFDLIDHLDSPFQIDERWEVSGNHYARTSEDWVEGLERNREKVMPVLEETYGAKDAGKWFQRWRVFFLACAELFAYDGGKEWVVCHQRLRLSSDKGQGR